MQKILTSESCIEKLILQAKLIDSSWETGVVLCKEAAEELSSKEKKNKKLPSKLFIRASRSL